MRLAHAQRPHSTRTALIRGALSTSIADAHASSNVYRRLMTSHSIRQPKSAANFACCPSLLAQQQSIVPAFLLPVCSNSTPRARSAACTTRSSPLTVHSFLFFLPNRNVIRLQHSLEPGHGHRSLPSRPTQPTLAICCPAHHPFLAALQSPLTSITSLGAPPLSRLLSLGFRLRSPREPPVLRFSTVSLTPSSLHLAPPTANRRRHVRPKSIRSGQRWDWRPPGL